VIDATDRDRVGRGRWPPPDRDRRSYAGAAIGQLLAQFEQQLNQESAVNILRVSADPTSCWSSTADMAAYHAFAHRALSARPNVRKRQELSR